MAFIGPIISLLIGVTYGSISGFFGGRIDNFMMRIVDVLYAFPGLLFIILLMAFFKTTFTKLEPGTLAYAISQLDQRMGGLLFIFVGIWSHSLGNHGASFPAGRCFRCAEKEYVEAARTIGAKKYPHHVHAHPPKHCWTIDCR